jgi:sulfite exporter TauE/SafE
MIRFTWLRFRAQAAVVFGALAALAIVLAVTGSHLARLYDTTAAACKPRGDCSAAMNAFANSDSSLQSLVRVLLLAAPALTGMFWGAAPHRP